MSRSLWDADQETKRIWGTFRNTYDDFEIGTRVKVICKGQDFHFFWGETGTVVKNSGRYLGITVEFDTPRLFTDGSKQEGFNFEPDDLYVLEKPEKLEKPQKGPAAGSANDEKGAAGPLKSPEIDFKRRSGSRIYDLYKKCEIAALRDSGGLGQDLFADLDDLANMGERPGIASEDLGTMIEMPEQFDPGIEFVKPEPDFEKD